MLKSNLRFEIFVGRPPQIVPKAANDMMDVGRLQKFEGSITAQGKLLLHGPLMCVEGVSNIDRNSSIVAKPRELQVFLFEQSIIFSDIIGKKTQFTNPAYIYKNQIQVKYSLSLDSNSTATWQKTKIHGTQNFMEFNCLFNGFVSFLFFVSRLLSFDIAGKQNADGRIGGESSDVTFNGSTAARAQLHH